MRSFLADVLTRVLTNLASMILERVMEWQRKSAEKKESEAEIDLKLHNLKLAYAEAFDGSEVTDEQREKLRRAIVDFVTPTRPGGL